MLKFVCLPQVITWMHIHVLCFAYTSRFLWPAAALDFTCSPKDTRTCQACNQWDLKEIHRFSNLNFMNIPKINRSTGPSHYKACWSSWKFTGQDWKTWAVKLIHGVPLRVLWGYSGATVLEATAHVVAAQYPHP